MVKQSSRRGGRQHKVIKVEQKKNPLLVDRLIYFAAIVEPFFSLPQAYQIFVTRSANDVSLLTWAGFQVMTAVWIWYAIVHKEKMILIYQGLYFIIDGLVLIGAIRYGATWL